MTKKIRSIFAKSVHGIFLPRIEGFVQMKDPSQYTWPGESVYVCRDDFLWLVIIVSPDPKGRDAFTVEVGWSKLTRFPELGMRPSGFASQSLNEWRNDEFVCRLNSISVTLPEFWTLVSSLDNGSDQIRAQLSDAAQKTEEHGIPYLTKIREKILCE